ncbi:MAG: V-type ATPase subunit [bacterium]
MLKAAFHYSYINAKVRALKSHLLRPADYESLARVSGCHGLAEYLKLTSYGKRWDSFPGSFDGFIHMYYGDLFHVYEKIINLLSGGQKRLVQHLYQRYELENLKHILRIVGRRKSAKDWKHLLLPTKGLASFSVMDLLQAKDMDEILHHLRGTWYYDPLKNSLYRFEQEQETFPLEMALDLSYYRHLWEYTSPLNRPDRKVARHILGIQLDTLNILWIFRFKELYHFSPEEILNYTLMDGTYLSSETRLRLAYSVDYKDMVANLSGTPYQSLLDNVDDPEVISAKLLSYGFCVAKKNWKRFPFQIGTVLDYLLFKEIEVKDLISLTEAKRLNLPQERIKDYLILTYLVNGSEANN